MEPKKYDKPVCTLCAFQGNGNCDFDRCSSSYRSDKKNVIFKKLEKVGEPYNKLGIVVQKYKVDIPIEMPDEPNMYFRLIDNTVEIEIKQNKEDMEENKTTFPKEDNALTRTVYAYINGKISDEELIKSIKEMPDEYPYDKNSLKPFSLEAAKAGKPVCTRDGRKARIICFDAILGSENSLIVLINNGSYESLEVYKIDGRYYLENLREYDLMMLLEKKEGWVNVYYDNDASSHRGCRFIYDTKEQAVKEADSAYITTVKINWEE